MGRSNKVFIDSNVWFSFFWGSKTIKDLLTDLIKKEVKIVVSERVLLEVVKNIGKKKPDRLGEVKEFFLGIPIIVVRDPSLRQEKKIEGLAEVKDQIILSAAVEAKCGYLLTGNLKDFKIRKIKKKHGLAVVSPSQGLKSR